MTLQEVTSGKALVISALPEADAVFRSSRYGSGTWLKDEESSQRFIDVTNRTKKWIEQIRRGEKVPELTFIGKEVDLVLDNLHIAQADTGNKNHMAARAILEELIEQPMGARNLGELVLQRALPAPELEVAI